MIDYLPDLKDCQIKLEEQIQEKKLLEAKILSYREKIKKDAEYTDMAILGQIFEEKGERYEELIAQKFKDLDNNILVKEFDEYFGIKTDRVGRINEPK
jgi:hypothetical protein